jgi:hypothetical protein
MSLFSSISNSLLKFFSRIELSKHDDPRQVLHRP